MIDGKASYFSRYTKCKRFEHGTTAKLEQETVTVTCRIKGNTTTDDVYRDAYIVPKKLETKANRVDKNSWNVLVFGMDSMSRARAFQSMPKLVNYFKQNSWLDYKAFQKVKTNLWYKAYYVEYFFLAVN